MIVGSDELVLASVSPFIHFCTFTVKFAAMIQVDRVPVQTPTQDHMQTQIEMVVAEPAVSNPMIISANSTEALDAGKKEPSPLLH